MPQGPLWGQALDTMTQSFTCQPQLLSEERENFSHLQPNSSHTHLKSLPMPTTAIHNEGARLGSIGV